MATKGRTAKEPEDTKTQRVYSSLRKRIRDLDLAPGTQLRKQDLAAEFSVSRAPISEALAKLANEGLVDIYPQSGTFVAPIRDHDIRESMIIRTALEVETVRRATAAISDARIDDLRANLVEQERAVEAGNLPLLDDLDAEFHTLIVSALDAPRLKNELESCRARLDRQRFHGLREESRAAMTLNEHRRIFEAIESRDVEYAAAAMRAHLNYVNSALERCLERGDEA